MQQRLLDCSTEVRNQTCSCANFIPPSITVSETLDQSTTTVAPPASKSSTGSSQIASDEPAELNEPARSPTPAPSLVGPISGGVIGSIVLLYCIVLLAIFISRRNQRDGSADVDEELKKKSGSTVTENKHSSAIPAARKPTGNGQQNDCVTGIKATKKKSNRSRSNKHKHDNKTKKKKRPDKIQEEGPYVDNFGVDNDGVDANDHYVGIGNFNKKSGSSVDYVDNFGVESDDSDDHYVGISATGIESMKKKSNRSRSNKQKHDKTKKKKRHDKIQQEGQYFDNFGVDNDDVDANDHYVGIGNFNKKSGSSVDYVDNFGVESDDSDDHYVGIGNFSAKSGSSDDYVDNFGVESDDTDNHYVGISATGIDSTEKKSNRTRSQRSQNVEHETKEIGSKLYAAPPVTAVITN